MEKRRIRSEEFTLVKKQRSGICIYRGKDAYLRIGPPELVSLYVNSHSAFEELDIPVARILHTGEDAGEAYVVEESLGDKRFLELFEEDIKRQGKIAPEHFAQLLEVVTVYLTKQIRSPERVRDEEAFAKAVHLELLCSELPGHAEKIQARFKEHAQKVSGYPYRFVHGDFNPANIFPRGIIDFEDIAVGPIGYDAVSAIETQGWFPPNREFEFYGRYQFSEEEKRRYYNACENVFVREHIPPLAPVREQLAFFRAIWLTVRMHHWTKLQKHRYDLFVSKYLS